MRGKIGPQLVFGNLDLQTDMLAYIGFDHGLVPSQRHGLNPFGILVQLPRVRFAHHELDVDQGQQVLAVLFHALGERAVLRLDPGLVAAELALVNEVVADLGQGGPRHHQAAGDRGGWRLGATHKTRAGDEPRPFSRVIGHLFAF